MEKNISNVSFQTTFFINQQIAFSPIRLSSLTWRDKFLLFQLFFEQHTCDINLSQKTYKKIFLILVSFLKKNMQYLIVVISALLPDTLQKACRANINIFMVTLCSLQSIIKNLVQPCFYRSNDISDIPLQFVQFQFQCFCCPVSLQNCGDSTVGSAGVQPRLIQGIRSRDGVGEDQETTA